MTVILLCVVLRHCVQRTFLYWRECMKKHAVAVSNQGWILLKRIVPKILYEAATVHIKCSVRRIEYSHRMNVSFKTPLGWASIILLDLNASLSECECIFSDWRRHIHRIWIKNIYSHRRHAITIIIIIAVAVIPLITSSQTYVNMNGPLNALKFQLNL